MSLPLSFDLALETLSLDELRTHQDEKLRDLVQYVFRQSDFYHKRLETAGIVPEEFAGLEDVEKLPTICKEDFRLNYPLGMCAVQKHEIREMHMSSGSTGTPIIMPYTENDLLQWSICMGRCFRMAGARPGDPVQITPSFGLFNGGFGMYHGARRAGLFVIPTGSGNTERQIRLARDLGTKILGGVVSYGIRIMEVMQELQIELPELKIGIFGAETFTEAMKEQVTSRLGIEPFDIYGMTETGGVGTLGMDCPAH